MKAPKLISLTVLLLFHAAVTTVFAQDKPKAGDTISGIVTDSVSPLMAVYITELDSADRAVAYAYTDLNGEFSFRLVNPKDRIQFSFYRKERIVLPIDKTYYKIRMGDDKDLPPTSWEDYEPLDSRDVRDVAERSSKGLLDISINTTDPGFYKNRHISDNTTVSASAPVKDSPKAGDTISGIISDKYGPAMMINVTERDSLDRVVAHSLTDFWGYFSFRLVSPENRIRIITVGYETVDIPIDTTFFEIKMKEWDELPQVEMNTDSGYPYKGIPIPIREAAKSVSH